LKRKFIFLFDNDSNDLSGVMKSRKAALEFLESVVQSGDEIAFFSCSPITGLTVHEYFTSDHQKIREALTKMKSDPGESQGGLALESFSEHELANPEQPKLDGLFSLFKDFDTGRNQRPYGRRDFIMRMTDLAKALRQVDGQKNIILFSRAFRTVLNSPSNPDALRFKSMAKELASANCPVFVINTAGGMDKQLSANSGLSFLSDMSGGRYYDNADNYAENARSIKSVTSNYYVLGYAVGAAWDGKLHSIKVEILKKGYRAYGQKGYFNPAPFNKLSAMEKSLHLVDVALGEDPYFGLPASFPLAALPFSDGTGTNTLIISMIPIRTILENVGKKTEVISLILTKDKSIVTGRRAEIDWGAFSAESFCLYAAAALAPGRYDARVVVRNLETGKSAVGACPVEVPEPTTSSLKLFPPLIVAPYGSTQYANLSGDISDKSGQAFSLSRTYLFPTGQYSPLIGDLEEGSGVFRAVLRCEQSDPSQTPDLRVWAWLDSPNGQRTPLEISLLNTGRQNEILFLLLEFRPPGKLMAGSYALHILAEDSLTKTKAETTSDIRII
jgi:VWFA-related protein